MLSFCIGCGRENKAQDETPLLHAYRLIDENRTDEAISLLSDELTKISQTGSNDDRTQAEITELRVTLASAYAKKAGISIKEIAKSMDLGQKIAKTDFEVNDNIIIIGSPKGDQSLKEIIHLFAYYLKLVKNLSVIPQVEESNVVYLTRALKVLDGTQNLKSADLLYTIILELVYFKTILSSKELSDSAPRVVVKKGQCVVDVFKFKQLLEKLSKVILSGYENLAKLFPANEKKYESDAKSIVSALDTISTASSSGYLVYNESLFSIDTIYVLLGLPAPNNPQCDTNDDF